MALESLKAKGVETTLFLREFYESHYSADVMSVVIYGSGLLPNSILFASYYNFFFFFVFSGSLDHMQEVAIKKL